MKDGVVILNFARDVLVDQKDIVEALESGKVHRYVTDFATQEIKGVDGAIVIPHLGASTEESEDNCAKMAVAEIRDFLENGNITHSVNYPDCNVGVRGDAERITILHKNIPNMIGQFTTLLAQEDLNIALMTNKSRKEFRSTRSPRDPISIGHTGFAVRHRLWHIAHIKIPSVQHECADGIFLTFSLSFGKVSHRFPGKVSAVLLQIFQ